MAAKIFWTESTFWSTLLVRSHPSPSMKFVNRPYKVACYDVHSVLKQFEPVRQLCSKCSENYSLVWRSWVNTEYPPVSRGKLTFFCSFIPGFIILMFPSLRKLPCRPCWTLGLYSVPSWEGEALSHTQFLVFPENSSVLRRRSNVRYMRARCLARRRGVESCVVHLVVWWIGISRARAEPESRMCRRGSSSAVDCLGEIRRRAAVRPTCSHVRCASELWSV